MMREAAPQPATSSVSRTGLGGMGQSTLQQTNLSEQLLVGRKSRVTTDFASPFLGFLGELEAVQPMLILGTCLLRCL